MTTKKRNDEIANLRLKEACYLGEASRWWGEVQRREDAGDPLAEDALILARAAEGKAYRASKQRLLLEIEAG